MKKVKLYCRQYDQPSGQCRNSCFGSYRCCVSCPDRRGMQCSKENDDTHLCAYLRAKGPLYQILFDAGAVEITNSEEEQVES